MRPAFALLLPNYGYTKDYFAPSLGSVAPFYVSPSDASHRYVYVTPPGFRNIKAKHRKTAPFVSMWYCHFGRHSHATLSTWFARPPTPFASPAGVAPRPAPLVSRTHYQLPNHMKDSNDKSRKRLRKKQREALKKRGANAGAGAAP